ncbi:MAG: universal stress protein [Dehalococcoidia bacterium]
MYDRILVPLDGSELAECVLPHVESIAKGCEVQDVVFLRVIEPFEMPSGGDGPTFTEEDTDRINSQNKATAESYLTRLKERTQYDGVSIQTKVISGKPAESIIEYANDNGVDLITIATHGRSGISRWVWGSVTDRVTRSASVPVLIIRPPGCPPGI